MHSGPAAGTASRGGVGVAAATTHVKRAKRCEECWDLPCSTTLPCWQPVCAYPARNRFCDGCNNIFFLAPKIVKRAKILHARRDLPSSKSLSCWVRGCGVYARHYGWIRISMVSTTQLQSAPERKKNANEAKKVKIEIYFVLLLWCKVKKHKKPEKIKSEESPEKKLKKRLKTGRCKCKKNTKKTKEKQKRNQKSEICELLCSSFMM